MEPLTYDAFVSYRHAEPDRRWAKWLESALETYRVPRRLVREKGLPRRLTRVFRDEDEVPASADLGGEIERALAASRFLIVVCSPRTPESLWVNREVERFRELGRGDRILALLIEGEPASAFPRALREIRVASVAPDGGVLERLEEVEPLAADVRRSRPESQRYLKRMARLRLLACLLGCRFDDLNQRDARRRRARLAWLSVAALVLVAALTAVGFRMELKRRDDLARVELEREREVARVEGEKRREVALALSRAQALGLVSASRDAGASDPMLGLLLAHAALLRSPPGMTEPVSRLHEALSASRARALLPGRDRGLRLVRFSPGSDRLVLVYEDGGACICDLAGRVLCDLEGHAGVVTAASFSPDGARILTASADGTARVWSRAGESLAVLRGHAKPVIGARFDAQGARIVTASADGTALVWDAEGRATATLVGHDDVVYEASFSPRGDRILTSSADRTARLWSVSGEPLVVLRAEETSVGLASFSPRGDRVVAACGDASARVWDLEGDVTATLRGHGEGVTACKFVADGEGVIASSYDGTVRVWSSGGVARAVIFVGDRVFDVVPSPEVGGAFACCDDSVRELDLVNGSRVSTYPLERGDPRQAEISPDGRLLALGARLWSAIGEEAQALWVHQGPITSAAVGPRTGVIVTGSHDGTARVWDARGDPRAVLRGHAQGVLGVALSPAEDRVLTGSLDGTARIFDLEGRSLATLTGHDDALSLVAWSPRGDRLVTASFDGRALLRGPDGGAIATLRGHDGALRSAVFSPTGELLVTGSQGLAIGWSADGEERWRATVHGASGSGIAFDARGDRVLVPGLGAMGLLDLAGQRVAWPEGTPAHEVAALSPVDGRLAVAGPNDSIRVTGPGLRERVLRGHTDRVQSLAFSRDGRLLLSSAADGTARLWDLGSEEPPVRFVHRAPLPPVLLPSGDRLLTFGGVRGDIWLLRREDLSALAQARSTRALRAEERRRIADLLPLEPGETYEAIDAAERRRAADLRSAERAARRARALASAAGRQRWMREAERSAAAALRTLASAQEMARSSGFIDEDGDAEGEFAGLRELAGAVAGRRPEPLENALLGPTFADLGPAGERDDGDYLLRLFLRAPDGSWVGEPAEGFRPGMVDPQRAERAWCAFAWPREHGVSGERTYFVDQEGALWESDGPAFSGPQAPTPDAGPSVRERQAQPEGPARGGDGRPWTRVAPGR